MSKRVNKAIKIVKTLFDLCEDSFQNEKEISATSKLLSDEIGKMNIASLNKFKYTLNKMAKDFFIRDDDSEDRCMHDLCVEVLLEGVNKKILDTIDKKKEPKTWLSKVNIKSCFGGIGR